MIHDWVIGWFLSNSGLQTEQVDSCMDRNYLEAGLIDSFGFLGLLSACEEELGVVFDEDDFSRDPIFTLRGLIEIIEEKKRERA